MIGQPKNKLDMRNPQLLQHPVFRDLIMLQPFLDYGCDSQMDLVRSNPAATLSGGVTWKRNEYGPGIFIPNDYDYYHTHIYSDNFKWYDNTVLIWCSSEEATPSGREIAVSLEDDSTHYFKLGVNAGALVYFVRSSDGYHYPSDTVAGYNDGHTFMLTGSSSPDAVRCYYNDQLLESWSGEDIGNVGDGTGFIMIGDEPGGYGFDTGSIYLVAVWNRCLSAAEITMLYNWGPNMMSLDETLIYRAAISAGAPAFKAGWVLNSNNQVL